MVATGELTEKIEIQQATEADDAGGSTVATWSPIAGMPADGKGIWARVLPQKGGERLQAGRESNAALYLVTIRRRRDVTAAMRVVWHSIPGDAAGDIVFNIRNVATNSVRRDYLDLDCERGAAV